MSSPLTGVLDQIVTTWEALTPPSRTSVTYHMVDARARLRGDAGDRAFHFDLPVRLSIDGEAGATASQVRWGVRAELRLTQAGRSLEDLFDAVANESNLLSRAVEKTSSWPANVIAVITQPTDPQREEDTGDALISIAMEVVTSETD